MQIIRIIPFIIFLLFCILIAYRISYLKKRKIQTADFKISFKTLFSSFFLLGFFTLYFSELVSLALGYNFKILPAFFHMLLFYSIFSSIAGLLFQLLAFLAMYKTLLAFNSSLRFGLNQQNLGKLVTTGIFRYSRNPFFLSILALFFGIALVFPTPFFVGIFVLSAITIHFYVLKEEQFLQKNYGNKYTKYTNEVRRYF